MEEFDWLSGAACFASLSPGTASGSGGSSSKPTEDSVDLLLAQWAV
jgi:hypothetical protein